MVKAKKEKTTTKKKAELKIKKATVTKTLKVKRVVKKEAVRLKEKTPVKKAALKHKGVMAKEKPAVLAHVPLVEAAVVSVPVGTPVAPVAAPKPAVLHHPVKPAPEPVKVAPAPAVELKELELELPITVKDIAIRLQEKPSIIIKHLMGMGVMAGINHTLEEAAVQKLCQKYQCRIKKAPDKEELALLVHQKPDGPKDLIARSPIVTFMGHVDHGKTSLMDAIRKTKVVDSEHGGITQHIGAYRVSLAHGEITFLDTPGHEAFTAMRARGASITDIVVLVVAADDGVMPQTQEAIDHARAAGVPIIVAMNKIDKPGANLDRLKKQLQQYDLAPEDWGGKTIVVAVSAKTGEGIDTLLEMILLEAQMLELKANPKRLASGVVIEAKMAKGRGPVATLLIEKGTLHLNENIIVGNLYGKVRAMFNDHGHSVTSAGPGVPVEILGISAIPQAGEKFFAIEDEREAKELAAVRLEKEKQKQLKVVKRVSLEDLHSQISEGKIKELKLIVKADVQGSLEAIRDTINKLNISEIKIDIIHAGVGDVNPSDIVLAVASNALICGFNVTTDERAKELGAKEGVEIKIYNIIYELGNEIKAAVEGMLEPKLKKVFLGRAEVRKVFKLSRSGTVAGCFVTKGKFTRNSIVELVRNGAVAFEGKLSSLKRFKDDVRDVAEGFECGMTFSGFDQLQEGDIIEAYEIERIARKL